MLSAVTQDKNVISTHLNAVKLQDIVFLREANSEKQTHNCFTNQ